MKPISIKHLCSIISLFFFTVLFSDTVRDIQNLVSKYNNNTLYQIEIEQENHYKAQNKTLKSHGFLYRDGTSYLIIFDKPTHQFIKFTEREVSVYDSSVKTAYLIPFNKFPSFNPALIFNEIEKGKISLKNKQNPFNISIDSLSDYFEFISMDFDFKKQIIQSISYQDQMNNKVMIKFISHRFNKKHKLDIKNYTYPKDTKVFKQ